MQDINRNFNEAEGPENNPVLLWLFKHGWEDPDWGQSPVGQVVTALVIHELADRIIDSELNKEIKTIAGKIIEFNAGKMVSGK